MKNIFARVLLAALLAGAAIPVSAGETGIVQGTIVDAESGETLIGANVVIREASGPSRYGTATDLDGRFELRAPVGVHTIDVSYVSYAGKSITDVRVDSKGPIRLNISLTPESIMGEEVVVTARAEQNNEASMLAIQQKAGVVTDGISSELMSRASSSDAGDALKRVTGITVVGEKYVFVRGLGERYSNTQLNGANLPSPEPNRRVVPMDMFPAGLLENIQVVKTFSPDQSGDFAGGSVRIQTKDFPDRRTLSVGISSSMHSSSTFKDGLSYSGGGLDFLGMDDGTRDIPDLVKTKAGSQPVRERGRFSADGFTETEIQELGRTFTNVWSPQTKKGPLNQGYSVSYGHASRFGSKELGYILSLTYDNSTGSRSEDWYSYRRTVLQGGEVGLSPFTTYNVNKTTNTVTWGALFNTTFRLSPLHKISVKTLLNRNTDDEARIYEGFNSDRSADLRNLRLRFVERGISTAHLAGDHHLGGLFDSNVEWQFTLGRATRNEPDSREVLYEDRNGAWTFFDITSSGSRFYFDLVDDERSGSLDWSIPLDGPARLPSKIKMGGVWRDRERRFDARRFRFEQSSGIQRFVDLTAAPEVLFAPENIAPGRFELRESTQATDNYSAAQDFWAGYLMLDMPISSRLRLVGGARVEHSNQTLLSFDPFSATNAPIEVAIKTTDVLPGINLLYKAGDKTNLRGAFSRTLARPDFRELAPFEFIDFVGGRAEVGNPDLDRSLISNFDLRYENFPRLGELMAVSAFYKDFTRPIEQIVQPTAQLRVSYQNARSARNFGLEFELRRRLDAFIGGLERFSLNANLTLVKSDVEIDSLSGVQTSSERALQGQSPYAFNAMLGYDNPEIGNSSSLLYNVNGRRISEVGAQLLPDVFEEARHQVDFVIKQRLASKITMKAAAKNILNSRVLFRQGDETYRRYLSGRSVSLGFSYEL